jgi:hypothetical protein
MPATADHAAEQRHLLDRPQPLGFLPMWWFWNNPENWRLVGGAFAILAVITLVALNFVPLPSLAKAAIAGLTIILANGLLEKYVRRQAMKRRCALTGDGSVESLPPSTPED